jgi:hypothetical protein
MLIGLYYDSTEYSVHLGQAYTSASCVWLTDAVQGWDLILIPNPALPHVHRARSYPTSARLASSRQCVLAAKSILSLWCPAMSRHVAIGRDENHRILPPRSGHWGRREINRRCRCRATEPRPQSRHLHKPLRSPALLR